MARVLLHSLVFAPDGVSTAYLMTDLALELQRLGHMVTVLTTTPHYNVQPDIVARQPLAAIWRDWLFRSELEGMQIWHVRLPLKGQRVSSRLADYLRFHLVSILASRIIGPYDIVIAPSPPLTIGLVSWLLGVLRGVPSIYNVQEIYPDFAINQGVMRNRFVIGLMRFLERFVYAANTEIVPISPWFTRLIRQRGVRAAKIRTIPNFVDMELYHPLPRVNSFTEKYELDGQFVISYGGNIGLSQDWESVFFAAEELASLPIVFVIIGDGIRHDWLRGEVERRRLSSIRILGYQPREMMPEINASSDLCIIPMKATTTSDTFPSKIYTIMACARAVVVSADDDSELAWIVNRADCGWVVSPDSPAAFVAALREAYIERDVLRERGRRGHEFVRHNYTKEAVAAQYDTLIAQLLDRYR